MVVKHRLRRAEVFVFKGNESWPQTGKGMEHKPVNVHLLPRLELPDNAVRPLARATSQLLEDGPSDGIGCFDMGVSKMVFHVGLFAHH